MPEAPSSELNHEHRTNTTKKKDKEVFFGVPVVGFFRNKKQPKEHQSLTASTTQKSVRFQFNNDHTLFDEGEEEDDDFDDEDDDEEVDEEMASLASRQFQRMSSYGSVGESPKKHRSGKELWAIVRRHVYRHDFHIRDTVRQTSLFQSVRSGSRNADALHFRDINLPYDFTLLDCFLALVAYLAISVIAYSFVFEHWSVVDSMYFAVVTFTTIGYGDFSPTTTGGRLFCVLFALGGVAVLAIALGVVGHKIVESQVSSISKAETQFVDDWAKAFKKKMNASQRRLAYAKHGHSNSGDSASGSSFSYLNECDEVGYTIRRRALDIKSPWHSTMEWLKKFGKMLCTYLPALTPLFLGAFYIGYFEGWNWSDVIYYCVVTTTSIGYGDLTPIREDTRLFAVIFIPLSVGAMGHFLGTIATFIVEQRTQKTNEVLWKHELTMDDLRSMSSADGVVTELDFVVFMLKAMKKVDDDLIMAIRGHFHKLDLTNSGTLVRKDLELRAKKKLRSVKTKLRLGAYKTQLLRKCGSVSPA